ncbi:MAG TPA: hypothetical protein VHT05_08325 [Candidatus Elarobacter sp.]|jgi:hypothetical protein|nr:hypothetical protein [Candidatus Elarobacter sp.]
MPKVGSIELKIARVESFQVRIRYPGGADVRADRQGLPSWPYERAARDAWTVADWRDGRFCNLYPGFDIDVLDGDGEVVTAGQTRLETVRDSYE